MRWLNDIADEIIRRKPDGDLIVSSGVSPSGVYHIGTLREVLTADAVYMELKKRGRNVTHIHFVDDLDALRKVPAGVPEDYEKFLGRPLCSFPAPDGSRQSYADYYLQDFLISAEMLGIEMEVVRSHKKYEEGFFIPAIESSLQQLDKTRKCLEDISGRKLGSEWSPIQVNEDGYLKKRPFVGLDADSKTIRYLDIKEKEQTIKYDKGEVKLDWRIDWPARWWLVGVDFEPFGREHGTKGGSYDTGVAIVKQVFNSQPPLPITYEFINRAGETKKMSKSAGNTVSIAELLQVLPPEIVRYFVLRFEPSKQLFFDQTDGVVKLIDDYAALISKPEKDDADKQLLEIVSSKIEQVTISRVPFSHLVASYQAALKDPAKTMEIIKRTEHADRVDGQEQVIERELSYIDQWLAKWADDDVKFSLRESVKESDFSDTERTFFAKLSDQISKAPEDADGEWFHKAIYEFKDSSGLEPKQLFSALYKLLIGKDAGPRAGWFLSILPRDWLIDRLRFKV